MIHTRRRMLMVIVMTSLVWMTSGQRVEQDGLPEDTYHAGNKDKNDQEQDTHKPEKYLVTEEVFFDIVIGPKDPAEEPFRGRVRIACFGDITPITCLNFAALAKGHRKGRELLTYKNTPVHRVVKDFVIQMGDVTGKKGRGGKSIYGDKFQDENFHLSHRGTGWVSMANHGRDTNGSQFFILLQPARWLDGKHVVFGKVIKGMDIIRKIGELDTTVTNRPKQPVTVEDCGVVGITSNYVMSADDLNSSVDVAS